MINNRRFSVKSLSLLFILAIFLAIIIIIYRPLGSNPSGERALRIAQSPQYDGVISQFVNELFTPMSSNGSMLDMSIEFFFNGGDQRRPAQSLPEVASFPLDELAEKSQELRYIWFGHSTLLLELDGQRLLLDPVFSNSASPIPFSITRFQPPVLAVEQIAVIDAVLISHDHYDHLDYKTVKTLAQRDIPFYVPLGVGAHLVFWGVAEKNIIELDWWQQKELNGLTLTCTPARHFSGRGLWNRNSTLWAGWAITSKNSSVFYSGDSGYSDHYKTIGDKLGPFDLTLLENGAYSEFWNAIHQLPEQTVQAHIDLRGKVLQPVHWGMFDLGLHDWFEPIQRVTKAAQELGVRVLSPRLGEVVYPLRGEGFSEDWWSGAIE